MWKEGKILYNNKSYNYWVKFYELSSEFGIEGGKISKLKIIVDNITVCDYDREWATKPEDEEAKKVFEYLKEKYN